VLLNKTADRTFWHSLLNMQGQNKYNWLISQNKYNWLISQNKYNWLISQVDTSNTLVMSLWCSNYLLDTCLS